MRLQKSWLAIFIVVLMFLWGCGSGQTPEKNAEETMEGDGTQTTAQNTGTEAKKSRSYRVLFDFNVDPKGMSLTDNEYVNFLEEKTGIRIQIESPGSSGYMDKLNILMASGDYPDAFMVSASQRNKLLQFAADGMLTDLKPYLDQYPNFKNIPDEAWLPVTDEQGRVWGFPFHRHDAFNQVVYVNKTWLDALGLDVPKTIDEFYEVMKAFTEQDPDGNGKDDTFGVVGNNDLSYGGRLFKAAFGAETYKVVDGKVLPPEISEEYKQYLLFMNKLVREKILDPEWTTSNSTIFREKINTLKYGVFNGFWHFQSNLEFAPGTFDHYIAIEPPLGPNGEPAKFTYNTTNRHYIGIPATTQDVEGLMEFFDWVLSPEGTRFVYLGVEDYNYKMVDGKPQLTENTRHPIHWAFSLVKHGQLTDEVRTYLSTDYSEQVLDNLDLATKYGQLDKIAASLPYNPDLAAYNLDAIVEEYHAKAILGNEDIEKTWDDYVKRYRSSGGDKVIEFWTKWYNSR